MSTTIVNSPALGRSGVQTTENTVWKTCVVNAVGPIENNAAFVNLTDTAGSFKNTWFFVPALISGLVNETALFAMQNGWNAQVELTSINLGSTVVRFHAWK